LKEVELIVSGKVQGVGYRQYVAEVGNELKLAGSVKNLKDRTVKIRCKGNEKAISEFMKQINIQKPDVAPLIDVKEVKEKTLKKGTVKQKYFEEIYDMQSAEMSQVSSTAMKYLNFFREDTNKNFAGMDEKYTAISEGMFAVVNEIKKTNEEFGNRIEKTEKNIESLLKILAEKKG